MRAGWDVASEMSMKQRYGKVIPVIIILYLFFVTVLGVIVYQNMAQMRQYQKQRTEEEIQAFFEEHVAEYDEMADLLWQQIDTFIPYLYSIGHKYYLVGSTHTIDDIDYSAFYSDAEWAVISSAAKLDLRIQIALFNYSQHPPAVAIYIPSANDKMYTYYYIRSKNDDDEIDLEQARKYYGQRPGKPTLRNLPYDHWFLAVSLWH